MRKILLSIPLVLLCRLSCAQPLPSIGLNGIPNDTDTVCSIPLYTGSFSNSGFQNGDTVPDFTLYDINGDSVNLTSALQTGKPALLIAGSYTCPVFRGKIADINTMASVYAGLLNIYVIYTVEAHPIVDVSPYSGTVWVPSSNVNEGVLYEQPETYGERKTVVDSLLAHYSISAPVLIDGPCNNWWLNYGPAPNNAYLIDTNGIVFMKHPWYNKAPDNMYCAIDSLLGIVSGHCSSFGNNGSFSFALALDSSAYGLPGQTLDIHGTITNTSSTDNVVLDIIKRQINIPAGWTTAICTDICYAPTVDSVQITIPPSTAQSFIFYFYTDTIPSQGNVRVLFRNAYNTNNKLGQGFYGFTNSTDVIEISSGSEQVNIFPNPAHDVLFFNSELAGEQFCIRDVSGKIVSEGVLLNKPDISLLKPGLYFFMIDRLSAGKAFIKH
jgi:hypothetical protein